MTYPCRSHLLINADLPTGFIALISSHKLLLIQADNFALFNPVEVSSWHFEKNYVNKKISCQKSTGKALVSWWVSVLYFATEPARAVRERAEQMCGSGGLNDIQVIHRKIQVHRTLHFPWIPLWLSWERIHLQCGRPGFDVWVGKIPWRRERLPTPGFWPGEFHELYSPWGHKESDTTEWPLLTPSFWLSEA